MAHPDVVINGVTYAAVPEVVIPCADSGTASFYDVSDATLDAGSKMLNEGSCKAQIRFVFADGQAGTTQTRTLSVNDVLLKELISYG